MPIRFAISRRAKFAGAAAAGFGLLLTLAPPVFAQTAPTPATQSGGDLTLDLEQARQLAVYALRNGNPGLAIQLAGGLLQANPKDPLAHFVIASAYAGQDRLGDGRAAAARAYRYSSRKTDRFQAAQLAAKLAYEDNRLTLAQIWLRRTAIQAPSEEVEQQLARDYGILRQLNPWSLRLRSDLRPSSNVNNGADTALQIIDGVPVTGVLSGAARALSGLIGSADIGLSYRMRGDAKSATSLGGRLYVQRVALSGAARDLAPRARNADYASTFAEVSLRHRFATGPAERGGAASVDLALGESWWGGRRSYRFARFGTDRSWRIGDATRLKLLGLAERRMKARYRSNDADILGFGAKLGRGLRNGDRLSVTLALRDSRARHFNGTFRSASVRTDYTFGQPVGPARISAGLVLGYSDYPKYRSGIFLVPGGRQDKSVYGDLSLFFYRYDYAGFAPKLRLRAGRKISNDSRFDTRELSVSLGIESKF
jgi:hypothetical protein